MEIDYKRIKDLSNSLSKRSWNCMFWAMIEAEGEVGRP